MLRLLSLDLYNEKAILTTMDITTDGFGFMLCFGDLSWVPFTYSLQSRYLAFFDPGLSAVVLCAILAVKITGYRAFRGSNGEKDAFRTNPGSARCAHLETITTKTGRKLLRNHPNPLRHWRIGVMATTGTGCGNLWVKISLVPRATFRNSIKSVIGTHT